MASLCEEESRLLADSKYRSYVSNTEKALKGFESTSEWADLISTLAKLNKVSKECNNTCELFAVMTILQLVDIWQVFFG